MDSLTGLGGVRVETVTIEHINLLLKLQQKYGRRITEVRLASIVDNHAPALAISYFKGGGKEELVKADKVFTLDGDGKLKEVKHGEH